MKVEGKGNNGVRNSAFWKKTFMNWVGYCVIIAMIVFIMNPVSVSNAAAGDEFDGLREKWKTMLTGGVDYDPSDPNIAPKIEAITAKAQARWDTLEKSPDRTYLWMDQASETIPGHMQESYLRLREMALAYSTKGSDLENNEAMLMDIISGLEWLYANRYNETIPNTGNWYNWEIGTPIQLNDIVVLLYDQLSADQITNYMNAVERFSPQVTMTGANRLWKAQVVAVRGIIVKDNAKMTNARNGLSPVFLNVKAGDGFYEDGSFIQHDKHPYNGGYGKALLLALSKLMYLLDGSDWEVTDPNVSQVYEWVYRAFEPFIYRGDMMDMTRGREVARIGQDGHVPGHTVIESVLRLSQFAPEADAARFKSMVKYWLESDTYMNFFLQATIDSIVQGQAILNHPAIVTRGELMGHYQYAGMDRAVHRRPGFGLGISMSSSRIYNYESINGENIKGWYTGDGMTYLYNSDLAQFNDNYWPTVNPYRLPGTTVDTRTRSSASGGSFASPNDWTGGTSIQGMYGITGMQLKAYGSDLTANKSWFMFDDEVVALGSGITISEQTGNGWDGTPRKVETTVENRKLKESADNALTVNGTEKPATLGWSETMTDVSWAHLEGNVQDADIGYYFPGGDATVKGLREARTYAWSAVNGNPNMIDHTEYTRNYLSLWFDHGTNPTNEGYSYVLLPGKSSEQVESYVERPNIEVLENSEDAHAVQETTLNITGVNFWNDIVKSAGGITSNKRASVMMKETGEEVELSVSDPTQANAGTIAIELDRSADEILSIDPGITVVQLSPRIKFIVDVNGAKGHSFQAKFQLGEGDDDFGPRGQWNFDETDGLEAFDSSYHGHIGTLLGGPSWTTIGKFGGALDFDGEDDVVSLPNILNPGETSFTAMAWVKSGALGGGSSAIIGQLGTNGRNWLYMDSNGVLASDVGNVTTVTSSTISDGSWHHVAIVSDGASVQLYVDGQLSGSGNAAAEPEAGSMMLVGEGWNGKVDDLLIYSRTLDVSEISAIYDEGMSERFQDDFEDGNADGWNHTGSGNWSVVSTDDSMQYRQANGSSVAHSIYGNDDWTDYSLEAKVIPMKFGSSGNYIGIVARYRNDSNKYIFQYNHKLGKLLINKRFNDASTTIAEKDYEMAEGAEYTLKAVLNGSDLQFYVNDVLELSGTDASIATGRFGFVTYNTTARFDDVFVDGSPEALSMAPPSLMADVTDNDTKNDIDLVFEHDAAWTEALTEVKAGYVALNEGTEYTVGEGIITIKAGVLPAGDQMMTAAAAGYTIAEVRQTVTGLPSSDADISALTLSSGSLNPLFSVDTTDYTANVPYHVSSVTGTATLSDAEHASAQIAVYDATGTLVYGPTDAASGEMTDPLPLEVGDNRIEWAVTAEDGSTKLYKVMINRAEYSSILLQEDFEDGNDDGWSKAGTGNWQVVETDESKQYRQSNGSGTSFAVTGSDEWTDYVLEAKITPTKFGPDGSYYGLVARYQDNKNRYVFQYNHKTKKLAINKRLKDVSYTIAEKDYEMSEETTYLFKAILKGGDLQLYVNGTLELSGSDTSFVSGPAGFVTWNVTAQFDDVLVIDANAEDDAPPAEEDDAPPAEENDAPPVHEADNEHADETTTITVDGEETEIAITKETAADGRSVSTISIDSEQLASMFEAAGDRQVTVIEWNGDDPVLQVELVAAALLEAAKRQPDAIMQIIAAGASYHLPLSVLKDVPQDTTIVVSIAKVSDTRKEEIAKAAYNQGLRPLLEYPIDFTLRAGGEEISDFNGTYVERSLTLEVGTDPDKMTAVWVDENHVMHFAPSVFTKIGDSWEATIRSPHNSIYSVVEADKTFMDLDEHWAKKDVEMMANKLIVTGVTDRVFAPDQHVTRAEFAAILVRSLGLLEVSGKRTFTDVLSGDWYAGAVETAYQAGWITGFEDGTFRPKEEITREQMVAMIARAAESAGEAQQAADNALDRFSDRSEIADWAKSAVVWTLDAGIVLGMSDSIFGAKQYATRAQSVVVLKRMLQVIEFIN